MFQVAARLSGLIFVDQIHTTKTKNICTPRNLIRVRYSKNTMILRIQLVGLHDLTSVLGYYYDTTINSMQLGKYCIFSDQPEIMTSAE